MFICPLCNGFDTKNVTCPTCHQTLHDSGKVSDYFDDYSAYMDIDGLKMENGFPDDLKEHICLHLFSCTSCGYDQIVQIDEET